MRALIKKFKPALNGLALAAQDRSVAIQLGCATSFSPSRMTALKR